MRDELAWVLMGVAWMALALVFHELPLLTNAIVCLGVSLILKRLDDNDR